MSASPESLDVLHVIPGLGAGGAEHMLATLVSARRDRPLRQGVVHFLADGAMAGPVRDAGVLLEHIPVTGAWDVPLAVWRLNRMIRRTRPTVIQTWQYYADLFSLWALELSGHRSSTRLYWGIRCSDIALKDYRPLLRWTVAACAQRADRPDAIIANSYAGREAHRRMGYSPKKFLVIPNGIDTVQFAPDPAARGEVRRELGIGLAEPMVIHVARIDPMKNHAALIAAAEALPSVRFVSVGSGTEALAGPANLLRLGLRRDVARLLAAADIMLSTSRYGEGFSNAIAEAMATGLPVVATDVGDARRIVGDGGTIVAPDDQRAIGEALARLVALTPAARADSGARGRRHVDASFSLDAFVGAFDGLHRTGTVDPRYGD